ncbi:glycosyl hydrolase catalytic core-domain-containing protein [Apodospora peruviana]|uniref:Glycosyl hydrolase catalytic core-domain-containing protein n=1 Tax=Apodospora peruviana TaxID=516989 RepID=A0AAE0M4T4_9PEZI|nr:glycosyl hydrolase catalytic core-domain-containing protein [Apodospora peruviana]
MRPSLLLSQLLPLAWLQLASAGSQSPKRGLVFTPNDDWPEDNKLWAAEGSGLTWYYNFGWNATAAYSTTPQDKFEFVPMMWGAGTENGTDTYFLGNITTTMEKDKRNITHVLSFSHPEQNFTNGGSEMKPVVAARAWINNAIPLQKMGVKVGLPIVGDPYSWVDPFLKNCSALLAKEKGEDKDSRCTFDFMPITSYGNFSVLKSRVDLFANAFPDIPVWVVEYGYNDQDLATTQKFFNESLPYLDSTDIVERYAWFGAFRSIVSNVGPNGAMLDPYGDLTDIGSWYLGGNGTGNEALPTDTPGNSSCTAANPCGKNAGTTLRSDVDLLFSDFLLLFAAPFFRVN